MMSDNRVVIYSNGIADFQRHYEVSGQESREISIPVRQDHLADVLASFNVYGDVSLESPPTFRPSNELEGNISINPHMVVEDLANNLSGAQVKVSRAGEIVEGTLMGLHEEEQASGGARIHVKSLIVLTADGLRHCGLREIQSLKFLDDDVQKEIDKALQRNYQRIKPNSTFVELELATGEDHADAIVQYAIPAAAWKMSYRLRVDEGQATQLQGYAIVDNNTDEDWNDFYVSVVTGEPITFSTDLADSKRPSREHVNLVSEKALGDVGDIRLHGVSAMYADEMGAAEKSMNRLAQSRFPATTTETEIHEVGDFSIFQSETTVDIPAKRSTVIPMFLVAVDQAKPVLYYRHKSHPERPYRAIHFNNQAEFSLGRGVCTVFEEANYAGNCIIPSLKPGETALLSHALETGVSVRREQKDPLSKTIRLSLKEGFCYTSTRECRETHYYLKSSSDKSYELVLDHFYQLSGPDINVCLIRGDEEIGLELAEKINGGARYTLQIEPKAEFVIKVVEQRTDLVAMELVTVSKTLLNMQISWLETNLVETDGPLAQDPGVQACVTIHAELAGKRQEINDVKKEVERDAARQERLRENIKTGGQDELTRRWRAELDEAEQAIRTKEEETIPALREEEQAIRHQLKEAMLALSVEWSEN